MKKRKREKKRKIGYSHQGMLGVFLVTTLLNGILVYKGHEYLERLTYYENRMVALQEAIDNEYARTEQIDQLKAYMKTDAYTEEVARDRLGLVKENEILFVESK